MAMINNCTHMRPRTCAYLALVDELSKGNVSMMPENVADFKVAVGAVLELEPEKIAAVRWRSTSQFNSKCRSIICCCSILLTGRKISGWHRTHGCQRAQDKH